MQQKHTSQAGERTQILEKLKEDGRRQYDAAQVNLSWQTSRTDEDITQNINPLAEMFGGMDESPEEYRARARRDQDKLDRQGREAYASEYAETQILNLL